MSSQKAHTILYIDDDIDDFFLLEEILKECDPGPKLIHEINGERALALARFLQKEGITPSLIVLDVNMPVFDGKQTLIQLRTCVGLQKVPVILFSTSMADGDKEFVQKFNAEFFIKPRGYNELLAFAHELLSHLDAGSA